MQEEATILCSLHHPNIVRFYGMAIDASPERGASYFLVTDLKQGDLRFERTVVEIFAIALCRESLIWSRDYATCRQLLQQDKVISNDQVLRMACQICEPLVTD